MEPFAERAVKAFHLALRLRVTGSAVAQANVRESQDSLDIEFFASCIFQFEPNRRDVFANLVPLPLNDWRSERPSTQADTSNESQNSGVDLSSVQRAGRFVA
jgi:hypothetical protein